MKITQSPSFARSIKKLHSNQKKSLDRAVKTIAKNPAIGEEKVGDLAGIAIYKFKINNLEWLVAYRIITKKEIKLLVAGPHENFYRDLKRGL
jgi:hypothetical protein